MKRIVIDTNLLVLLVVGLTDPKLIGKHKRTKVFRSQDWDLLVNNILPKYNNQIVVTPHILTEAFNLLRQIDNNTSAKLCFELIKLIKSDNEESPPSIQVIRHPSISRLGLTDCAILGLIGEKLHLITVDWDLFDAASRVQTGCVFNFNYLRKFAS